MLIANPIYDVVFKYLMEDSKVAKLFVGALTGFDILELDFLPQEGSADFLLDEKKGKKKRKQTLQITTELTIYRIDFSAKIKTEEGEKLVIIELQKSKLANDVPRFRMYLGRQYMNREFFKWVVGKQERRYKAGIPIYPIFILGEGIEEYLDIPVLLIDNCVRDRHTQEVIDEKGDFIPSLFHKGLVINVPALSDKRRDELEKMLSIFDQDQRDESHHIMNVSELDFPSQYRPIIRRLQTAIQSKELRSKMQVEDEYVREMNENEELIAKIEKEKEEAMRKIKVFEVVNEILEQEKNNALQKAENLEQEKNNALQEKESALQKAENALRSSALLMRELGVPITEIAQKLGVSVQEIEKLIIKN